MYGRRRCLHDRSVGVTEDERQRSRWDGSTRAAERRYCGASADGSKVFFTSNAELTNDAYTGPDDNAPNLYEYELSGEPGVPGRLTDLSVDDSGNGAGVLGLVQISEDGSYVYFVAEGDLAEDATPGAPNLYVSHDGGRPRSSRHSANDVESGANGRSANAAVVSPSGAYLAFQSRCEPDGL